MSEFDFDLPMKLDREDRLNQLDATGNEDLRKLVDKWRGEEADYPAHEEGEAAAAGVRLCADELEELIEDE